MGDFDTDEIIEELFESFVKSANFVLDGVKKVVLQVPEDRPQMWFSSIAKKVIINPIK